MAVVCLKKPTNHSYIYESILDEFVVGIFCAEIFIKVPQPCHHPHPPSRRFLLPSPSVVVPLTCPPPFLHPRPCVPRFWPRAKSPGNISSTIGTCLTSWLWWRASFPSQEAVLSWSVPPCPRAQIRANHSNANTCAWTKPTHSPTADQ